MKFKPFFPALLFLQFISTTIYAAGGAVDEDFKPLLSHTENMTAACKKKDVSSFKDAASLAMRITAENRNNSMVLPSVSAKIRAAKSAVNKGNFEAAIAALQEADAEMQKKRVMTWDGGSE